MRVQHPSVPHSGSFAARTPAARLEARPCDRKSGVNSCKAVNLQGRILSSKCPESGHLEQRTSMGSATQAPFISCSEVHNIKGHALMIRYPGNSKARRENYTYPTSNILAKMKMISVELGREITLWIYQCVGVQFFFRLSEWICAFGGGDVNIKGIKGLCVTSVFPEKGCESWEVAMGETSTPLCRRPWRFSWCHGPVWPTFVWRKLKFSSCRI